MVNADDTTLMAESEEEFKSLLMEVKVESGKVGSFPLPGDLPDRIHVFHIGRRIPCH